MNLVQERRSKLRGFAVLKQLIGMHIYKINSTVIPQKERVKYGGTNLGDMLGPVKLEPWQHTWKLTPEAKNSLYGDNRREATFIVYCTFLFVCFMSGCQQSPCTIGRHISCLYIQTESITFNACHSC